VVVNLVLTCAGGLKLKHDRKGLLSIANSGPGVQAQQTSRKHKELLH
jgi:hypothetical protein